MPPDTRRWQRIQEAFTGALEQPRSEREAYLRAIAGEDPELLAEVEAMLLGHELLGPLAIEKRSSEVWQILGAVKTQFGDFGKILEKTKKKLQEATNVIDSASQRSRVIERKLRTVQELPSEDSIALLGKSVDVELDEAESVTVDEDSENDPELPF